MTTTQGTPNRTRFLNADWSVTKRGDSKGFYYSVNNEREGHICGLFEYWTDLIKDLKKEFSKEDIKRISALKNN